MPKLNNDIFPFTDSPVCSDEERELVFRMIDGMDDAVFLSRMLGLVDVVPTSERVQLCPIHDWPMRRVNASTHRLRCHRCRNQNRKRKGAAK